MKCEFCTRLKETLGLGNSRTGSRGKEQKQHKTHTELPQHFYLFIFGVAERGQCGYLSRRQGEL